MKREHLNSWFKNGLMVLALAAGAGTLWLLNRPEPSATLPSSELALVVPDDLAADDVHISVWRDAAAETGFALSVVTASDLLKPGRVPPHAALILPDSFHRKMNAMLIAHVQERVRQGSPVMLIYDAGLQNMDGSYAAGGSRFSGLAGVGYGLYDRLGQDMQSNPVVHVDAPALRALALPPGKVIHHSTGRVLSSDEPVPSADEALALAGYLYGRMRYTVFNTRGVYDGQRLMHGEDQELVAGLRQVGQGRVLFVNLPLTFLKLRTDGLLLHSFLRLFAQDVAQLPQLSPMANAQGGIIMNWHIDAGTAQASLEQIDALGVFEHGPYSSHLTAGPDVNTAGDGMGMNLPSSPAMQAWVRRFAQRGDEVGNHGGWIHNEFGRMVSSWPHERSIELIERNAQAVQQASQQPMREYSGPVGNHPAWVTQWLQQHGYLAYYFTGDIGMAPTRAYQNEERGPDGIWAFPVMSFGSVAAFEEAQAKNIAEEDVADWLIGVSNFCAQHRTARLVYAHPPGVAAYPRAFQNWLKHTEALARSGRLRWITMAQYATFANQRLAARWQMEPSSAPVLGTPQNAHWQLTAQHPESLAGLAWVLPASRYAEPVVVKGQAQVIREGPQWIVKVQQGKELRLSLSQSVSQSASASVSPTNPPAWSPPTEAAAPAAFSSGPLLTANPPSLKHP